MSSNNGQLGEIAANLARLGVAVRALRSDVDELRREVRSENAELRGDLALALSRQNQDIEEAKKKQSGRRAAWPTCCPHPSGQTPTVYAAGACCTA